MAPSASRFTAVPTTIWSTRASTVKAAKRPPTATPAHAAAATPANGEPDATATAKPANAPVSIVPSIPMLIRPARSITSSPSAASSSGAASRSAASSSASISGVLGECATGQPQSAPLPEREANGEQDHDALHDLGQDRRHARLSLHRGSSGLERAKQQC